MKRIITIRLLSLVLLLLTPMYSVQAATYRDVPLSHFAHAAVDWVSNPANGSFMVGDASNNFNPNRTIDKFEAAKIFAMAAGYKYAANAISPAEQELFNRSYTEWGPLLDNMATQYARWSKTADREIAYLLQKNILTVTDVSRFVKRENQNERITNLTKQDAIVYMLRMDGRQPNVDAVSLPYHTPFRDDSLIQSDYKKYIYYAREAGIANGSDGLINPERDFTRAEMAQLFYNVMAHKTPALTTAAATSTGNTDATISGIIDYTYLDTHVYITVNGLPRGYKIAGNAVIMVDNTQRSAGHLKKGMTVTLLTNNANEVVSLVARSVPEPRPAEALTDERLLENEGHVVSIAAAGNPAVRIRSNRLKLTGEIVSEERNYTVALDAAIRRGETNVKYTDIKVNDIIIFKHSGFEIVDITLEDKNRTINGTLIEKIASEGTDVTLVVEDDKQVRHRLHSAAETKFIRGTLSELKWNDLRIGDTIRADCEYDRLLIVHASGVRSNANGTIAAIHVTQDMHQLTLRKADDSLEIYALPDRAYDVYALRIGMTLRLSLESREIYALDIL